MPSCDTDLPRHQPHDIPVELPGYFVVFEGGDGSGKSTQAAQLVAHLTQAGVNVVPTREPGGTALAERIRGLVLDPAHAPVDPTTEALLFAAARSHHVRHRILPALEQGAVVVSDRFVDSSIAYQGAGRGLGEELVAELNEPATGGLRPDLTVLLDVAPETAQARRAVRERDTNTEPDRMESEPQQFHGALREAFLHRAQQQPERYLVLDARQSQDDLARQISVRVNADLAARSGSTAPATVTRTRNAHE